MKQSTLSDPYEAALIQTLSDRAEHGGILRERRQGVLRAEQRDAELIKLARHLFKAMQPEHQAKYMKEYPWLTQGPDPASRQAVLAGIIDFFSGQGTEEATAPDVERALAVAGIHAESKRIYNSLNYLAADGRLERVERGLYRATARLKASKADAA